MTPRTKAALLESARDLAPHIQAFGDQIERDRQLPKRLIAMLGDAGLFTMLLPQSLGGSEVDLATFGSVVEEIAKADASTAWCISQGSGCSTVAAFLDPEVAREMFNESGSVLAWGPGSAAKAVGTCGGYRVTGRWSFASGCRHATWLGGVCQIYNEDGSPKSREDGSPDSRTILLPAGDAEIIDVWHVSGLRGTGSDDFAVADLFVPERRTTRIGDPATRRQPGQLYLFPVNNVYATGFASVAVGIARSALDAFVALARGKTPRGAQRMLRDNAVVQLQVAEAEADLRSARSWLHETLRLVWDDVARTKQLTLEHRIQIRLAATHAIHHAAHVVDTAYLAAGATAIFESNPFERGFRDVHAVTQQLQGRLAHYETAGQFFLGLDPDTQWL